MIPFNKPFLIGSEIQYIEDAVRSGKISGNGKYTKMCQQFFEQEYGFKKALLTSSCTDALEMAAILADIKEGDEVIIFNGNPTLEEFSGYCQTIPYEVLTSISRRVKRIYIKD